MLTRTMLQNLCRAALAEDVGSGDATTLSVVPENLEAAAVISAKEECVCAGLPVAAAVFAELDPAASFDALVQEGAQCAAGQALARIEARARALLTGERSALNFLQRLCGIATLTRAYVDAAGRSKARILDTRKTTPGLRALEKYAVVTGGGTNHRFGLYDRIMIKDNHLAIAGIHGPDPIPQAVEACRELFHTLEVEVEADSLGQVEAAVRAGADCILLDNMDEDEIAEAVQLVAGRALLEVSGGVTLDRVPRIAALGVDYISVGALTHSARSIDIGMEVLLPAKSATG